MTKLRLRETMADHGRPRETTGDNGRQLETTEDNGRPRTAFVPILKQQDTHKLVIM